MAAQGAEQPKPARRAGPPLREAADRAPEAQPVDEDDVRCLPTLGAGIVWSELAAEMERDWARWSARRRNTGERAA
ncbi:DUF6222 family protein [Saccharopolyspora indica]|uniref:DUF6222 family protein n=1 Tax=Saccharopolyspora indica TaxID=1229659 RepID=UPI0022EB7CFD|nr:DUF6222 family protein [Saccharopolyspora indica]MDA3646999.1 DUF6222 family protein [Saccharopolyspora indica]